MAGNSWFQFKQFRVIQEKAAMKIGTDTMLLGAWTDVSGARHILDVGTGTGILSLMLAQRSDAQITAIEIEKNAAEEAAENVRNSPWPNQVAVENISFQEFAERSTRKYDRIISNPPFFGNNLKSASKNLAMARHNDLLSLSDLAEGAEKLLSENGKLSLVFPVESALKFTELAVKKNLFPIRQTEVSHKNTCKTNRFLLEFSRKQLPPKKDYLSIQTENGYDFSAEFKKLTRDFYLRF